MNKIVIKNREPQEIKIGGGGAVIGVTEVLVNGVDVTQGSIAYVVVPTKTSELDNDSGFITQETDPTIPYYIKQITQADINSWDNKQDQLISGINIKTINGSSIMGSGNLDIDTAYTAGTGININEENVISNTITSYNDLTDLPTIPTKTSDLTNDNDFVESNSLSSVAFSGDYEDLINKPTIPTSTSELENDSGYITNRVDDLINYYDKDFLYNLLPKSSGTGSNITLDNTYKSKLELTLSPSTLEQRTNLYNNDIEQGAISEGADVSSTNRIRTKGYIEVIPSTQLYIGFSGCDEMLVSYYNSSKTFVSAYGWASGNVNVSIPASISYIRVAFRKSNNANITPSSISNVQIGNIPNPSYPQDIHKISGSNTISVYGKQLFDKDSPNIENGYLNGSNGNVISNASFRVSDYIDISNFSNITISGNAGNSEVFCFYDISKTFISAGNMGTNTTLTTSVPNNAKYLRATLNASVLNQYMVESGTTPSPYTPYTLETKDIDLGDIEYCKIGNYADRIFKNVESDPDYDETLEVGTWYLKKNIGKVVLDGTELNWSKSGNTTFDRFLLGNNIHGIVSAGGYSNYFKVVNINVASNLYELSNNGNSQIVINYSNYGETTLEQFKEWLGTHNVSVYYVMETPTYTPITGTLEDQLNSIQSTYSENEQTNISQINNDLPFQITATTLKDISNL